MRALATCLLALTALAAWPTVAGPVAAPHAAMTQTQDRTPYAVLYTDGSWATMTPLATVVPPTVTPTQELTLPPTATPITPSVTPTPSATMTPSITPTLLPKCWGTVAAGALNVRDDVWGAWIGQVSGGDVLSLEARKYDSDGNTWYRIWYEPSVPGYVAGWYIDIDSAADCTNIPTENTPPQATTRAGFHILMGQGGSAVEPYAQQMQTVKCLDGSWDICRRVKAVNPDVLVVCRSLTVGGTLRDGPLGDEWFTPEVYAAKLWPHLPPPGEGLCDAIEVVNEWGPTYGYDVFAQWSISMAQLVEARYGVPMLAFSFGPGNPDFAAWIELVPYLEWVAANPLPDGSYHGIAWHGAAHATWSRSDSPWVNDPYVTGAGRYGLVVDYLDQHGVYDLRAWPGLTAVTEIGVMDGYSGNWDASYSCAEKADAYQETARVLTAAGIDLFTWWNLGQIGIWHSDHDCVPEMAQ